MSAASLPEYLHLAYLVKPATERVIYRKIRKLRAVNLVALGLDDGVLAKRMIRIATRFSLGKQVHFTGIDLYEMRASAARGMSLKEAHRLLRPLGAKVQLVPGDPLSALARTANLLLGTDLVVVRADQDLRRMQEAWFYVPRMLHAESIVLVEQDHQADYQVLDRSAVDALVDAQPKRRRAA